MVGATLVVEGGDTAAVAPEAEMPLERLEAEICELAGHLAAGECRWLLLLSEFDRRVAPALERLWHGDDPYLRLAAAQAELGHRRDRAKERLAVLAGAPPPWP